MTLNHTLIVIITNTMQSCSGPLPAQNIWGHSHSVSRAVFSYILLQMDFYYSHCFSWGKKHTKSKYHMPWLYQLSQLPFHRSHRNWWNFLKNVPPWTMEALKWNLLISIVIIFSLILGYFVMVLKPHITVFLLPIICFLPQKSWGYRKICGFLFV